MLFIYFNLTLILLALIPEQTSVSHTVAARVEPRGKMTPKVLNYSELTEVAFNVPSFASLHSLEDRVELTSGFMVN